MFSYLLNSSKQAERLRPEQGHAGNHRHNNTDEII